MTSSSCVYLCWAVCCRRVRFLIISPLLPVVASTRHWGASNQRRRMRPGRVNSSLSYLTGFFLIILGVTVKALYHCEAPQTDCDLLTALKSIQKAVQPVYNQNIIKSLQLSPTSCTQRFMMKRVLLIILNIRPFGVFAAHWFSFWNMIFIYLPQFEISNIVCDETVQLEKHGVCSMNFMLLTFNQLRMRLHSLSTVCISLTDRPVHSKHENYIFWGLLCSKLK